MGEAGRRGKRTKYCKYYYINRLPHLCLQLFLEEERELELERLYENGVVETLNHRDEQIGSGAADAENTGLTLAPTAEATSVSKQTAETLTAGEKVIEALELADAERATLAAYEEAKSKLSPADAAKLPPPQRNALLAALDMEPEDYVLVTIEKISNTALLDALLVLPFAQVLSMMAYLDEWARAVRFKFVLCQMRFFMALCREGASFSFPVYLPSC